MEGAHVANKPPLGDANTKKQQGQIDNIRTQRSFRIGKFQTKKQLDTSVGQVTSPLDFRFGSNDVSYSRERDETDQPFSPNK